MIFPSRKQPFLRNIVGIDLILEHCVADEKSSLKDINHSIFTP